MTFSPFLKHVGVILFRKSSRSHMRPFSKKIFQLFDDFKQKLNCLYINEAMHHTFDNPHAFEYLL